MHGSWRCIGVQRIFCMRYFLNMLMLVLCQFFITACPAVEDKSF
jgi:hypothetical protein